ncbi:MAG: M23 family metallopeptidase [Bacilli bacterium]|nr:M23 family metallopeptidase [Bacilli bacterium]MDD3896020.1 M23 family metallopeptidase [Bacilli bacterium]MDD4407680.1 M23 family metallopeptidase [Bacilli bacterium]
MVNIINKHNKLLIKRRYLILFFFITYFLFTFNVNAANFNYAEFNFDEFTEKNLGYWTDQCAEGGESNEKCKEKIISKQKNYYTRLYKILAAYQKKGITIDDNIIITTTFYGLTPDLLNDDGTNYDDIFGLDNSAYNYLDNDFIYDIDIIPDKSFFEKETDTLDLLIRNMFSYGSSCYAVYGDVTQVQTAEGVVTDSCLEGGTPLSVDGETKCAVKDSSNILTFIEYAAIKLPSILNIFGIKSDKKMECENNINNYPGAEMKSVLSEGKEYNLDAYWKFLETTNYFDKKAHLRTYFMPILKKVGISSMEDFTFNKYPEEYAKYEEEIIEIRKDIISYIKSILEEYGSKKANGNLLNIKNSLFWWPIGGSEITESNGVSFALGEPVTFNVTSDFGKRGDSFHHGLDIGGAESGTINIIAARNGIVEKVVSNCTMADGLSCGGKYGNYIVLSHPNGSYTYYAHLHEGTIEVSEGQSVEQGQVLGKMGSTGNSTGTHLHFEVRIGGDTPSAAINPLDYISAENPRQNNVSSSDLLSMLICMEGAGPDDGGSNYQVYDDSKTGTGTLTVGAGVTLINHKNRFIKRGFDIDNYMYEGALIPKAIVDDIKVEIITNIYDNINSEMNNIGINLTPYQIDALVSRQYNVGNISNFSTNFQQYGNTQTLYDVYMSKPTTASGFSGDVLKTRREREWNLFHSGTYFTC